MAKIKQLSPHEAQKIAAGEVVERPANVVKELIENAIDAGATQIIVMIEKSGQKRIRVIDNGCGMSLQDARLCFQLHATSKLTSIDDLSRLLTHGFRGEALASIAAVSMVTLITKENQDDVGVKLSLMHGTIIQEEIASCTTGVDISIDNLFANVPARKKFLKSEQTEWRAIQQFLYAMCLAYPSISFKLLHDDKQIFNCPGIDDCVQRSAQLWEHTVARAMIPLIETEQDNIKMSGAISTPHHMRYDRNHLFFFVNKRWIKNYQLANAILKGYMNVLPAGKFPTVSISLEIDPSQVDINIHPRKEEVQFLHPHKVYNAVQHAITRTLEQFTSSQFNTKNAVRSNFQATNYFSEQSKPQLQMVDTMQQKIPAPTASFAPFDFESFSQGSMQAKSIILPQRENTIDLQQQEINIHSDGQITENNTMIIGQFNKTYILIEHNDGLLLIDQHAAHERILYELFANRFNEVVRINLLFPLIINLTSQETTLIEQHREIFLHNGIELDRFSQNQIIIQATPVHLKEVDLAEFIKQVVSWIIELQHIDQTIFAKTLNEKMHAQMACKAAIKAGDCLTQEAMRQLIADLDKTDNRFTCPHGRPTSWLINLQEIEKKFKRNYK